MILYTFINNSRTRNLVLQRDREKKEVNSRFLYYMAHGLDGALVGYLASGFFVTVLYYPYFWINLAMTVSLNAIARKKIEGKDRARVESPAGSSSVDEGFRFLIPQ